MDQEIITESGEGTPAKKKTRKETGKDRILKVIVRVELVILLLLAVFVFLKKCTGKEDVLKGTWVLDSQTSYHFGGEGEGVLHLPGDMQRFHYDINGDTLVLDFLDAEAADLTYTYRLEGNALVLQENTAEEPLRLTKTG